MAAPTPEAGQPTLAEQIRSALADLQPLELEIRDDSARHAGHAGAREGGHFHVRLVSAAFDGQARVQRHRMVYERVAPLMKGRIHALALQLQAPGDGPG